MRFHTCITLCRNDGVCRGDWDSDKDVLFTPCSEAYGSLPASRCNVGIDIGGLHLKCRVLKRAGRVAGIFNLETGEVGLGMLVLSGRSSELEQRYCLEFQWRIACPEWRLPLPPLEIDRRPLLYHVVFRLGDLDGQELFPLVDRVIRAANGLGVAFLCNREPRRQ